MFFLWEYFDEMAWQICFPNILVWACCSMLCLLLFLFLSLFYPLNGQYGFRCLHESYIKFYPWHSSTCLMSFRPLQHKKYAKHCSCVILWGHNDISIFMIIFSKIQDLLVHNFYMKYVGHHLSFQHPLRSSQIHFNSSSNIQIIAHIWSCPGRSAFTTSNSIMSMI